MNYENLNIAPRRDADFVRLRGLLCVCECLLGFVFCGTVCVCVCVQTFAFWLLCFCSTLFLCLCVRAHLGEVKYSFEKSVAGTRPSPAVL
jgi:hypothetical protein